MKIRLMGSPDLVRAWKTALEQSYGIHGAEYPSRRGGTDLRVYFDLDDRVAEKIVASFQTAPVKTTAVALRVDDAPACAEKGPEDESMSDLGAR